MTIPTSVESIILQDVVSGIGVVFASCVTYLTAKLKRVIDTHLNRQQAEMANTILNGLASITDAVVNSLAESVVKDAKTSGGWNAAMGEAVKRDAIAAVKSQSSALCNLGQTALGDMDELIGTLIENAIRKRKYTTAQM